MKNNNNHSNRDDVRISTVNTGGGSENTFNVWNMTRFMSLNISLPYTILYTTD